MTHYLLDTNILSDLIRHPQGAIARAIEQVGEATIFTSVIVAAELRFGAAKMGSARLSAQLEAILDRIPILSLEPPADSAYGQLRAELAATGMVIGANDMLIASHALSSGAVLVTDNEREFSRVHGLVVENWLRAG